MWTGQTSHPAPRSLKPSWTPTVRIRALIQEYFNTAAFTQNALGTFGNTGKNILQGPGVFNTDIALLKDTKISDRVHVAIPRRGIQRFQQCQLRSAG